MAPITHSGRQMTLQSRPRSQPDSHLHRLPQELRDLIYCSLLNWPILSNVFPKDRYLREEEERTKLRLQKDRMTTPSILLVDRQISAEAIEFLYAKPFVFDTQVPDHPWKSVPMDLRDYVSERTLQRLRFAVFRMDLEFVELGGASYWWSRNVAIPLDIWSKNTRLEQLTICADYTPDFDWPNLRKEAHHRAVRNITQKLQHFGRTVPVIFEDDIISKVQFPRSF